MTQKKILLTILLTVLTIILLGVHPWATAQVKSDFNQQRMLFLKAETTLNQSQFAQFQKLKKQLVHYPLYPYLLSAEFNKRLQSVTYEELHKFMETYPDSPLSEQLKTRWLQTKAEQKDWIGYLKAYKPSKDTCLQCNYIWAQMQTSGHTKAVLDQVQPLWLKSKTSPKACTLVFKAWEESGLMTRPMLWQRIKLVIQEGNESLARYLAKYLTKSELALVELWIMIHNNPYLITEPKYFVAEHPAYLEMIVHGASQIAKSNPTTAIQMWQLIHRKYPFTERHWGLVVRAIGLAFAKQRHPEAEKWLTKVPNIYTDHPVHEWRIRVALTKEDWHTVLHWIKTLPEEMAKTEEWKYWHARALEKVGRTRDSQAILTEVAPSRSYYGFLASKHLLKPYYITHQKINVSKAQIQAVHQRPGILRAQELYLLGRRTKALAEWQLVTNRMNDPDRQAAAKLALQSWNLPNWSILALSNASNKDVLDLRFPLVHAPKILNEAEKHQIDPALIFAVTRQESAFISDAKSSAGAMGLMQLIPSTAAMIAKKKQIKLKGSSALFEPHVNIQLGSGYLKMLLDKHQKNSVLAAVAYNAGPGRIKKWLPVSDMDADTWIETIPFKETREYVKNVMTYTVIYQQLLGKKPTLSNHMPHIPGTNN